MRRRSSVRISALLGAALIASLPGCSGQDGPTRYKVSGKVTLNGKPAPVFEVFFRPDSSQGNSGPGSLAKGLNGTYETRDGKGVSIGPHRVDIVAYDGIRTPETAQGTPLTTKTYTTTVVIPAEDSEQNFDVPASYLVGSRGADVRVRLTHFELTGVFDGGGISDGLLWVGGLGGDRGK